MGITIVRRGQPRLLMRLDEPGAGPVRDWRAVFLEIRHPRPPVPDTHVHRDGCWPGFGPEPRPDQWNLPPLVYPAVDLTPGLELVFGLDARLWARPPGRHEGTVFVGGVPAAWLDIDLRDQDWLPSDAGRPGPAVRRHGGPS
jgi:hypothetical protein